MALHGMLIGLILFAIHYATALQLNLDDHGCIRREEHLLDWLTDLQHQFNKQQALSRMA
jgi:hypothetical protein